MVDLKGMTTEAQNPESVRFSSMSIQEAVELMNREDANALKAVSQASAMIAKVIEKSTEALRKGGRIIYTGAGTSGRLGVLDAVECPPTFGVDYNTVIGLIAGGENAFVKAKEGAEDSKEQGAQALQEINLKPEDIVIGVAASGRTPYVIGALEYAAKYGSPIAAVVCNPNSAIEKVCPDTIVLNTGPEVLSGSTRLKAGTATKMTLNMISTISMAQIGKVYKNYMVDVKMTNEKLVSRGRNMVCKVTGASMDQAIEALEKSSSQVKTAIIMLLGDVDADKARSLLQENHEKIDEVLAALGIEQK